MNFRKLLIVPLLAAVLILTAAACILPSRHSTERAVGALQKTNSVSLCVSDARGRHVKETRHVSKVQDETRPEADRHQDRISNDGIQKHKMHKRFFKRHFRDFAVWLCRSSRSWCRFPAPPQTKQTRWPVALAKQQAIAIPAFPRKRLLHRRRSRCVAWTTPSSKTIDITIVAEPSHNESHHSLSQTAETTSHAAESTSVSKPCQMECGACTASASRQQRRERGILQPATSHNPSIIAHSRFENSAILFLSNEDWEQTSPRGPPADLL